MQHGRWKTPFPSSSVIFCIGVAMASQAGEQLRRSADLAWDQRWTFIKDANGDGIVTISDVSKWVEWLFFVPGDLAILALIKNLPDLAVFLEITPNMLSGWLSGIVSLCAWLIIWSIFSALDRG
jgi:hypothetical protein